MEVSRLLTIFETKGAEDLIRKEKEMTKQAERLEDALDDVSASTDEFGEAAQRNSRRASNEFSKFERDVNLAKRAIVGVIGQLSAVFGGGLGLGQSIQQFAEFESGLNNVITLLDDSSFAAEPLAAGIDNIREGLLSLSAASGQGLDTLNKSLFDTVSAGVPAGEALEFLTSATELALVGGTQTATAVDGLTSSMNAFQIETSRAGEISQQFFTAQKFGKTNIEELSSSIGQVAPIANALGVSIEETLASFAALTAGGIKTSEAATGLKAALANISKPSKEASETAEALGLQFDFQAIKSQGLAGFLEDVIEKTGGSEAEMLKLFGSMEAVNSIFALTGSQADLFQNTLSELNDKTKLATTFSDALAVKQQELRFIFDQAAASISAQAVRLGAELAPSLSSIVQQITAIVNSSGFTTFTQILGQLISAVIGFGDAFISSFVNAFNIANSVVQPFLSSLIPANSNFLQLTDTIFEIGTVLGSFAGYLVAARVALIAFNLVLRANPLVAIISTLATAITYLISFRNEIRPISGSLVTLGDIFTVVFSKIRETISSIAGFFTDAFNSLTTSSENAVQASSASFSGFLNFAKTIFNGLIGAALGSFEIVKSALVALPNAISGALTGAVNLVTRGVEGMINFVIKGVNAVIAQIDKIGNSAIGQRLGIGTIGQIGQVNLGTIENTGAASASNALQGGFSSAQAAFSRDYLGNIADTIQTGFQNATGGIVSEAEKIASKQVEARIGSAFGESSPVNVALTDVAGALNTQANAIKTVTTAANDNVSGGSNSTNPLDLGGGGSGGTASDLKRATQASKDLARAEEKRISDLQKLVETVDADFSKLTETPIDDYNNLIKRQNDALTNAKALQADEVTIEKLKEANRIKEIEFLKGLDRNEFQQFDGLSPQFENVNLEIQKDAFKDVGASISQSVGNALNQVLGSIGSGQKVDFGSVAGGLASQAIGAIGSAFGPIGSIIGQGLGSLVGGLFGRSKRRREAERKRQEELSKFFDQVDSQLASLTSTQTDDFDLLLKKQNESLAQARGLRASQEQIGKLERLNQLQQLRFLEKLTSEQLDELGDAISDRTREFVEISSQARELVEADRELVDQLRNTSESLLDFSQELRFTDLSPLKDIDKLALARTEFDDIARRAQLGDATAITQFEESARRLLELSRTVNASSAVFANDFDTVERLSGILSNTSLSAADQIEQRANTVEDQLNAGLTDAAFEQLSNFVATGNAQGQEQTQTLRELSGLFAENIELTREAGQLTVEALTSLLSETIAGNDLTREELERIAIERLRGTSTIQAA